MIAAFAAVYIVWGSTYLGNKYALETLPTFLMAGTRFMTAGAILFIVSLFSKDFERPKLIHWRTSFIVGGLLLLGGNGGVVIAQHYIPSSLAALLVATEPFWIVIISWIVMGKARPNLKVSLGLLIGFIGVFLLIGGRGIGFSSGNGQLFGSILIIVSALSWASGSLYGLSAPASKSALQSAGMQMLSGGFLMLLVGIFTGELTNFSFVNVTATSWIALGYLTFVGSLVGFTAYSWLLKNVEPAKASTYAYVNPVIAVFLGWLIAGESFTAQMLFGAGIIVGSVVLITSQEHGNDDDEEFQIHTSECQTVSAST